jgi:hypothetical protein
MVLRKLSGVVLAVAVVTAMAAGCSSAKKTNVSAGNSTTTSAASSGGSTTTASSGSGGSTTTASSGSGGQVDCSAAEAAYAKLGSSEASVMTSGGKLDPSAIQKDYDAAAPLIPDNLKSDYNTLGNAVKQFVAALQGVDLSNPASLASNPAAMAKIQAAENAFNSADVQKASTNLKNYFDSGCK